ncbi:MAG TPA: hypothetical protein VFQ53_39085 [Kofleriaceae bacterium]|nr:hypothetical protein [Kofleriaceae bacterium]
MPADTPISSRTTFEVWQFLIYDEVLSRAVFDGTYRELAAQRGYSAEQLAVLDWFAAQPGMRWNVENLRFRAALETAACLQIHLPKTARLLTKGDDDWLQDICYEYLSFYHWDALGHRRLTECERFGRYVRERIMKRRITPAHLDRVLELELAVVDVLKQTAGVSPASWPAPPEGDIAHVRPRRGIAQKLLDQPIDLRELMTLDKPDRVVFQPRAVTWLIHLPKPTERPKMKIISDGARELLARCTGTRETKEIASDLERELELPVEQVTKIVRTWLDEGVLVA